jgi:hypothetical protein
MEYLQAHNSALLQSIADTGNLKADQESELREAIDKYKNLKQA